MEELKSSVDKELMVLGTILNCNKEIRKLNETSLNEYLQPIVIDTYDWNMHNLITISTGEDFNIGGLNENYTSLLQNYNYVQNNRGNYYAYFYKVRNFLNNYSNSTVHALNESLTINNEIVEVDDVKNIDSYKLELNKIIDSLEKQDQIKNLSNDIIKIKMFAKKPIFVHGFNLLDNTLFTNELQNRFKLPKNKIIGVGYDKSDKDLLIFTDSLYNTLVYNITHDALDYYNNYYPDDKLPALKVDVNNPTKSFSSVTGKNNIVLLYMNTDLLNLKYTDNLYNDVKYQQYLQVNNINNRNNSLVNTVFKNPGF
jgi:hypothetical protein